MVEKIEKIFQMSEENAKNLKKELADWNIETESFDTGYKFYIHRHNVTYTVEIWITDRYSIEERCFMFNTYPFAKNFSDIQIKIFGRIVCRK